MLSERSQEVRRRAAGIIVKDGKVLLFHRFAHNREYFVFPGGGIEANETPEEAVIRELGEELTIKVKIDRFIGEIDNVGEGGFGPSQGYYFLIKDFTGTPTLGGEEKAAESQTNQYLIEWHSVKGLKDMPLLVPKEARDAVVKYLSGVQFVN
jgi:8-oxo-dGTP pyrophosphatase MutT (NUDIX family)